MHKAKPQASRGFTLLELIIVIAILAILSVAVVLVINPAETLARARDSQRLSDLAAVKSAIGLYMAEVTPVILDGITGSTNTWCVNEANSEIMVSLPLASLIDDAGASNFGTLSFEGEDGSAGEASPNDDFRQIALATIGAVDGTGWIPVDLIDITSGAPLSNFPVDPTNTVDDLTDLRHTDSIYMYVCDDSNDTFELNASMESDRYAKDGNSDKEQTDGGDNVNIYEVGTSLTLIGSWE